MPVPHLPPPLPVSTEVDETLAFLGMYHRETGLPGFAARRQEIEQCEHLSLTTPELTHGARMAWRNSTRCVGRLPWATLEVHDLRHLPQAPQVFEALCDHLRGALNGGRIRPLMSVFGPGIRIYNDQLIRYAGYRQPDGQVIGDPQNIALTEYVQQLGWAGGPGSAFDVLPLAIEAEGNVTLFELPSDAIHEVPITHPSCAALAGLGLRWHALPVISNMTLEIGGQRFEGAPFNGWYLQTEIAARNLADEARYNLLPAIAQALGLDTSRRRTLWLDRALVELNVAVLHSFDEAGIRLADHHSVTRQFRHFEEREARAGRAVKGNWSWLVPPLSPATTPVWHRRYDDTELKPKFTVQRPIWAAPPARCPFQTST
ncbi:nitric oxide synthase [Deinococcus sp. Arct2-2]|uniref:nitric oxide synthase oxygenase n=1 Tax=Deinococcus sp. Arct2-2 TaxID=2568653 RepID=UPI0010A3D2C2|nr:nitric oxide synthase oxygenase [Deinococcus sp. Arct2-2]THF67937.1 nitric oxide synthase [Deinococcus sp. Arct2-2]